VILTSGHPREHVGELPVAFSPGGDAVEKFVIWAQRASVQRRL
jgi:hypothetical protein